MMIKSILAILGGLFQGLGGWMQSYASKENTKARIETDKNSKKDELNKAIQNNDLDTKRKLLG